MADTASEEELFHPILHKVWRVLRCAYHIYSVINQFQRQLRFIFLQKGIFQAFFTVVKCTIAVSYTHLDVYKRQN